MGRFVSLQRKCINLKEHLHDNPCHSSGDVHIILKVCLFEGFFFLFVYYYYYILYILLLLYIIIIIIIIIIIYYYYILLLLYICLLLYMFI